MANQNAGSIIKTLDMFGRPVAGTYKNKDTYGTIVGGSLTIVFILLMFLYLIILFVEPMDKTTTSTAAAAATTNTTSNETDGLTLRNLNNANTNIFDIPDYDLSENSKDKQTEDTANLIKNSQESEFESRNKNRDLSTSNWMYEIKTAKTLIGNDIYDDTEEVLFPFVSGFMLGFRPQGIAYTPTLYTIEYLAPNEEGLSSFGYMY